MLHISHVRPLLKADRIEVVLTMSDMYGNYTDWNAHHNQHFLDLIMKYNARKCLRLILRISQVSPDEQRRALVRGTKYHSWDCVTILLDQYFTAGKIPIPIEACIKIIKCGNLNIFRHIITHNLNITASDFHKKLRSTGLTWHMICAHFGFVGGLSYMLRFQQMESNNKCTTGKNALSYAIEANHETCVSTLLSLPHIECRACHVLCAMKMGSTRIVNTILRLSPKCLPDPRVFQPHLHTNTITTSNILGLMMHYGDKRWVQHLLLSPLCTHHYDIWTFVFYVQKSALAVGLRRQLHYINEDDRGGIVALSNMFKCRDIATNVMTFMVRGWFEYDGNTPIGILRRKNETLTACIRQLRKRKRGTI